MMPDRVTDSASILCTPSAPAGHFKIREFAFIVNPTGNDDD